MTVAEEQAPFHTLIKMVERELELAGQARLAELQEAVEQTGAFLSTLPSPAPASAQPLALRAQALRGRVTIETQRLKESIARSRTTLRRSRKIARRYGAPRSARISTSA
ncbi:MAG: hypothetical protein ACRDLT_18695 [Solirubrobacteraceae bacterium]